MTMEDTRVNFITSDELLQKLMDSAAAKSRQNIRLFGDRRVLVEGGGYEKIWLETQPMGGAMYAKRDLEVAMNNQRMFMDYQREDGRIPGSIALIDGKIVPQFNKFQGFCFPAPALDMYYLTGKDPTYLDQLYETLEKFDAYLWRVRDSDGDGCLESWCRYDTGEDNAERYGDAPSPWEKEIPPEGCSVVPMASMDVMSFSYSARETMAEILRIKGRHEAAENLQRKAAAIADKIYTYLWDDERGALFDRDNRHRQMLTLTHNTLRCMYWHSISDPMAARFVREHLLNPEEFWTNMPLPSVAVNDPLFHNAAENNWSGQCEALTYQRAIRALENYGYYTLIPMLGEKLFTAIGKDCHFVQQYDPFTMQPSGVDPNGEAGQDAYGPAMLSVMEYCSRMYGVHIARDEIVWGTVSGPDSSYEQIWNDSFYQLRLGGNKACATINGREVFTCDRGWRITTDLQGNILARCRI
jgi:hypothetical protein